MQWMDPLQKNWKSLQFSQHTTIHPTQVAAKSELALEKKVLTLSDHTD